MRLRNTFELAYHGLSAKPSRTFLTLLGVAIGVAAVITIASLGAGTKNLILAEISGLGADVLVVQPGSEPESMTDIANVLFAEILTQKDVDAVLRTQNVPHAISASPFVMVSGTVSYGNETYVPQIIGTEATTYTDFFDIYPEEGVMFGADAIKEKASVAVIGDKVRKELFGQASGLGENITIKDRKFKVVGVLPKLGQVAFNNVDTLVLVPYTTAQTYLTGKSFFNEFIVRVDDADNLARTERDVELTLRELHNLEDGEKNDFTIRTPEALADQVGTILLSLTILLTSVVAIALVVGGIGIMNMMLVSVTERTHEIGLRKAIGATDIDILSQFLIEAVMLTFLGGAVGIMFGALMSYLVGVAIRMFTDLKWVFQLPLSTSLVALLFSICIGLIFGIYPARKASRKSPMEALRYE
jgi:putative ABC transport system permease protein